MPTAFNFPATYPKVYGAEIGTVTTSPSFTTLTTANLEVTSALKADLGIANGAVAPATAGTTSSAPPASATIQTALGSLAAGTAFHNTLAYDVVITIYLSITANTSGVVVFGVGTTVTPTQTTLITGLTNTGIVPIRAKIPAGYYALLSISGTITDTIAGQYLEAA